jgi:protein arginine N-methyltransferase 1
MYSITSYGEMIADQARVNAYLQALRNAVKPGSIVLEIGTGLGFFAVAAARLGASEVFAIDSDDAIKVAQQMAATTEVSDRIKFIFGLSTATELPKPVDVIVSDLRGLLPLYQTHIPSIIDARRRLLKPSGILIPRCDTLWVVPVESRELYRRVSMWDEFSEGFDFSLARRIVTNTWWKGRVDPAQLLSEPQRWATLDYLEITDPDVRAEVEFEVARRGTVHGWAVWFDAVLDAHTEFSNHPGKPELTYGNAFFPLSSPVEVQKGNRINLRIRADLVEGDYIFGWNTSIVGDGGNIKVDYRQSTFFGVPRSRVVLQKQGNTYVPTLSDRGRIQNYILTLMDGSRTNEQIAQSVLKEFPESYSGFDKAFSSVTTVARKFSK